MKSLGLGSTFADCCSVCRLLLCIYFEKPHMAERRCSCTQDFELLREIQRCGRFTSNHTDVEISPDKVRFAFTPNKPCCLCTALRAKAWNTLTKSGWQQNPAHLQCYLLFSPYDTSRRLSAGAFLHLRNVVAADLTEPVQGSLSALGPEQARCHVVGQVPLTGMLLLSRSLWKWLHCGAAGLRAPAALFSRHSHTGLKQTLPQ